MSTEAQLKASKKYKQKSVKRLTIDFYPTDADIYEHVCKQEKKQTYIKELIRNDMSK